MPDVERTAFSAEFPAVFIGTSVDQGTGQDGKPVTFRSVLIADGAETLKLFANAESAADFEAAQKMAPASKVRVRIGLSTFNGRLRARLLGIKSAA